MKNLIIALCFVGSINVMAAQNITIKATQKNGRLDITSTTQENGETQVFQKSYDLNEMGNQDTDLLIKNFTDSIDKAHGKTKIKIKTKDSKGQPMVKTYKYELKGDASDSTKNDDSFEIFENDSKIMDFKLEDLTKMLQKGGMEIEKMFEGAHLDKKIGEGMKKVQSFDISDYIDFIGSKTIKGLKVNANKPNNGVLNISFEAVGNENIQINLMDLNGKILASKSVEKHTGEYFGQLELKNKAYDGTAFLTVVQGADGATKRVVIE